MTMEIREGRGVGPMKDHIYVHLDQLPPEILKERDFLIYLKQLLFLLVWTLRRSLSLFCLLFIIIWEGFPQITIGEVVTVKGDNQDAIISGLMAAGEAACASFHGANRLGANSLLDIVVFGRACANRVAEIRRPG